MKEPAFWEHDIGSKYEWKRTGKTEDQDCMISKKSSQTKLSKSKTVAATIQQTKTASQRHIISAKQIQKQLR